MAGDPTPPRGEGDVSRSPRVNQTDERDPLLAATERIEQFLRDEVDRRTRERVHRDFSYARFGGALAQGVVVALLIWALIDCLVGSRVTDVVVKLGFAAVLQGASIAAFVAARTD